MKALVLFMMAVLTTMFAFAQEAVNPDISFLQGLLDLIGGSKGMTTVAIVLVVVQLLIKFLDTSFFNKLFSKLTGSMKMLISQALVVILSIVTLISQGTSTADVVIKTIAAAAFQELMFRIYKEFIAKKQ